MNDEEILCRQILNLTVLACTSQYDELKQSLDQYSSEGPIHDIIACIAIKSRDSELLKLTNHHPRAMLDKFAPTEYFQWLVESYGHDYFQHRSIPSYVWANADLPNAIFLAQFTGETPENWILSNRDIHWQRHFGYKPEEEDDEADPEIVTG